MYRVNDLTAEEAKIIGELRWRKRHAKRYQTVILALLGVMVIFLVLTGIITWWVSLGAFVLAGLAACAVLFRLGIQTNKAGKLFVQSLETKKS